MVAREQAARTRRALSMEIHRAKHFFACFESVGVLVVIPKAVAKVDLARYLVLDQGAPAEGWCSSEERCTAIVLHQEMRLQLQAAVPAPTQTKQIH